MLLEIKLIQTIPFFLISCQSSSTAEYEFSLYINKNIYVCIDIRKPAQIKPQVHSEAECRYYLSTSWREVLQHLVALHFALQSTSELESSKTIHIMFYMLHL